MTTRTRGLPIYVSMNNTSEWHTSALLATAIDSVTLPLRLKGDEQSRVTFNNFEAAINTNENQHIAQLQVSIRDPHALQELVKKQHGKQGPAPQDGRMPNARSGKAMLAEDSVLDNSNGISDPDLDLMPDHVQITAFQAEKSQKPAHVFGRIDSLRGPFHDNGGQVNAEEEDYARKRRRIAGECVVERPVKLLCSSGSTISPRDVTCGCNTNDGTGIDQASSSTFWIPFRTSSPIFQLQDPSLYHPHCLQQRQSQSASLHCEL